MAQRALTEEQREKRREQSKAHYWANREKHNAYQRAYYKANRPKKRVQAAATYQRNRTQRLAYNTTPPRQEYNQSYRLKHRDRLNDYNKAHYRTHRQERVEYGKARYAANADEFKHYAKNYRATHREVVHARNLSYISRNRQKVREKNAKWIKNNPERYKAAHKAWVKANQESIKRTLQIRQTQVKKSANITLQDWIEIVAAHDGRCHYCGIKNVSLTQDHILSLRRGGLHEKSNIVPACGPCNSSKGWKFDWHAARATTDERGCSVMAGKRKGDDLGWLDAWPRHPKTATPTAKALLASATFTAAASAPAEWGGSAPGGIRRHQVARCRWCGGRFVQVFGYQWLCETPACGDRQIAHAIPRDTPVEGVSPYAFSAAAVSSGCRKSSSEAAPVHGAAGVSKSLFGRMYAYKRCRDIPGFRALLLRASYSQLTTNHMQYIPAEATEIGFKWTGLSGPNARQAHFAHNGDLPTSILFMGYCQDEGDIAQHIGPEWDSCYWRRASVSFSAAIREITARDRGSATSRPWREPRGIKGQTRILTNPGGRSMQYLKEFYLDKNPSLADYPDYNPAHYAQMQGEIADNPYLDEEYRATTLGASRHDARRSVG